MLEVVPLPMPSGCNIVRKIKGDLEEFGYRAHLRERPFLLTLKGADLSMFTVDSELYGFRRVQSEQNKDEAVMVYLIEGLESLKCFVDYWDDRVKFDKSSETLLREAKAVQKQAKETAKARG